MAMKYIKLFESWRLMEAEGKQDAFDVNKPDGWPVLQTTIGDLRKAFSAGEKKLNELLYSVFRRGLQTGDTWDKDAGKDKSIIKEIKYGTQPPRWRLSIGIMIREICEEKGLDVEDQAKGQAIYRGVRDYVRSDVAQKNPGERIFGSKPKKDDSGKADYITLNKLTKQIKMVENWIKNHWDKDRKKRDDDFYKKFTDIGDPKTISYIKNNLKLIDEIIDELPKAMNKRKDKLAAAKNTYYINITSTKTELDDEGNVMELAGDVGMTIEIPSLEDTSLNPDDAPITDFVCKEIDALLAGGEGQRVAKTDKLTLGMAMTWFNNYAKSGSSDLGLLSNTGSKNYQKNIASIFAGEEAADLPQFAATIKVGGQNLALANGADGTRVPIFVSNTVQGVCAFDFNKSTLQDSGKKSLEAKALWGLLSKATKSIEIIGHTDSVGKADYNKKLSEQRAQSVLAYLKTLPEFAKLKVQPTTSGKGSTEPIKDDNKGKDQNAAALNRRVVIMIDGVAPDYAKLGIK